MEEIGIALSFCDSQTDAQGRELAEHGTALFPVACYHDDLQKEEVPWHWHEELEALVVSEGTAVIFAENRPFTVHRGEGFFINTGVLHAAKPVEGAGCRLHSVVFHPRLVGGSADSVFWQKYLAPLLTNSQMKYAPLTPAEEWHREALAAIETAWQSCAGEPFGYEFKARAALSALVASLSGRLPAADRQPSEKAERNSARIKIMLQYIQAHYPEQITIALLARQAMISESECLRCFKTTIGTPPIQYLKQLRIQRAAELLLTTNDKIHLISEECGFQDVSYFVKSFREIKGCAPGRYRRG